MDRLRVLVADDEHGMRLGVRRVLSNFLVEVPDIGTSVQLEVDEVDCGEAAVDQVFEQPPDILILDHKMPGLSGLDVLDRIQGTSGDMLTIMITAYASIETAVRAVKRGAYDFLAKPFTPDELRNTVTKAAVRIALAKQARRLANERNEVRLQLMRTLSHELQAPLNATDGYLDLIKNRTRGDHLDAYAELLERSQTRIDGMRRLIRDLLDMTTVESKSRQRKVTLINLVDLANAAIETFEEQTRRHNLRLTLHRDGPISMHAVKSELQMILENLISNAVKYNRPGGEIHVTLNRCGDTVSIGVADTGWGIEATAIDRICDEFVRVKTVHTRDVAGTGLGLAIVKKIASLYAGDVVADSEPGSGSKFTVLLNDAASRLTSGTANEEPASRAVEC